MDSPAAASELKVAETRDFEIHARDPYATLEASPMGLRFYVSDRGDLALLGLRDACDNITTFYGYAINYTFYWKPQSPTTTGFHSYMIQRDKGSWCYFYDAEPIDYYCYNIDSHWGTDLRALLESYDSRVIFDQSYLKTMQFKRWYGNPWEDWAGRDQSQVTATEMCGRFISDVKYSIAENQPC